MAQLLANSKIGDKQIASEEFVNDKFQVVESLPASPVEGVFYFVKE